MKAFFVLILLYNFTLSIGYADESAEVTSILEQIRQSNQLAIEGSPVRGRETSPIKITEFASFTCGYCKKEAPVLKKMFEKYKGQVAIIFKFASGSSKENLLINKFALAAHKQGKFWEMHDLLFSQPKETKINDQLIVEFAKKLNLDIKKFEKDMELQDIKEKLKSDQDIFDKRGAGGTPYFVVNSEIHRGFKSESEFDKIILDELQRIKK